MEIVDQTATDKHVESFNYESPLSRATRLSDLGVKVLICGAVSDSFASMIETHGIRIIPFVAGEVEEVLDAYLTSGLCDSKFRMPGCKTWRDKGFKEEC